MQTSLTRLTADDGTRLVVHIWLPEWLIDGSLLVADAPDGAAGGRTTVTLPPRMTGAARPHGIILISHGMAEHASRYARSPPQRWRRGTRSWPRTTAVTGPPQPPTASASSPSRTAGTRSWPT